MLSDFAFPISDFLLSFHGWSPVFIFTFSFDAMKYIIILALSFLTYTVSFSQTQQEMNVEAYQKYKRADAELNKVYKELKALLSPEQQKQLVKAQRAWITFRDSHCNYEAGFYKGGSMQPLVVSNCLQAVTEQRVQQLRASKEELESR
jgi:uncharacterized protein YecT (DUF1311 family)